MRANLEYGRRYRATAHVDAMIRQVFTSQMVTTELARYQLFGRVVETPDGYMVEAQFRGRSGTYDLPEAVQRLEIIE